MSEDRPGAPPVPSPEGGVVGASGGGVVRGIARVRLPDGVLAVSVEVPAGPAPPSAVVPALRAIVDALVARTRRAAEAAGRRFSCRAGCDVCCSQLVPVPAPEMHAIARTVARLDDAHRERVLARFAAVREALDRHGLTARLQSPPADPRAYRQLMEDSFRLGEACPFLEDHACSIHAERPTICREYNVLSPAARCVDPFVHTVEPALPPANMGNAIVGALGEGTGAPVKVTPLPLALEWAAAHPEVAGPEPALDVLQRVLARFERDASERAGSDAVEEGPGCSER